MNPVPKPGKRKKKKLKHISESKKLKKSLDSKWSYLIKLIAGFRSEITPTSKYNLNSHHIGGKSTYVLRYSIRSGICITQYEHQRIHFHDTSGNLKNKIKELKGINIFDELRYLENHAEQVTLQEAEKYINYHISILEGKTIGQIYPILEKGVWI